MSCACDNDRRWRAARDRKEIGDRPAIGPLSKICPGKSFGVTSFCTGSQPGEQSIRRLFAARHIADAYGRKTDPFAARQQDIGERLAWL